MKNYFIANGVILDTDMEIEEMENQVQASLDECTAGLVQFKVLELSDNIVKMMFIRDFAYKSDKPIIFDADMNLITDLGIGAFQLQAVGGYPMIHPLGFAGKNFYTDITAFIRFYKLLLFQEMGQKVEHIGIRTYSDKILMQIIF